MHSHRERELDRITTARRTVQDAERAYATARAATARGRGTNAAAEFEDRQLHIARARVVEATDAHDRSERRRRRVTNVIHSFRGARAPPLPLARQAPPLAPADAPGRTGRPPLGVHEATRAYIRGLGAHDAAEDMHPHALDGAETELQDALTREELQRRAAYRDARDAI